MDLNSIKRHLHWAKAKSAILLNRLWVITFIKVLNVEAEPTLEQAKARIEAALKLKKAASAFNAAKEKLGEDAFNDPSSLAKAAANSGLKVENLDEWVTKSGREGSRLA